MRMMRPFTREVLTRRGECDRGACACACSEVAFIFFCYFIQMPLSISRVAISLFFLCFAFHLL